MSPVITSSFAIFAIICVVCNSACPGIVTDHVVSYNLNTHVVF